MELCDGRIDKSMELKFSLKMTNEECAEIIKKLNEDNQFSVEINTQDPDFQSIKSNVDKYVQDDGKINYNSFFCSNPAIGAKLLQMAAEQGYSEAQYLLGLCYYYGNDIAEHFKRAIKWYQRAAEQGHAKAQYFLGLCYYYGNGVEANREEAVKWIQQAILDM